MGRDLVCFDVMSVFNEEVTKEAVTYLNLSFLFNKGPFSPFMWSVKYNI